MPSHGQLIVLLALIGNVFVVIPAPAEPPSTTEPGPRNNADRPKTLQQVLHASLGRKIAQQGFNPLADLNGDGVVNVQDVALFKLAQRQGRSPSRTTGTAQAVAGTERIIVEAPIITVFAGQTVSVLFLLRDNTTPLSGYTVDVDIVADSGAVGTVTANVGLTNFFDQQNLITAGGATRDPLFSVIADNGTGGVSVTTFTDDFSTVLAVDGVNDVLAQVFFDVPLDALGDFTIQFNPSSTLIDGIGASVTFASTPGTIRVLDPASIPAVSEWGLIVMGVLVLAAGCVVFAKHGGAIGLAGGGCSPEDGGDAPPEM